MMLDELQRRNYAASTIHNYIHAVEDFARYFGRSPYRLGPDHIRQYQAHLFRDRKLAANTVQVRTAALRFLFVKTLKRPYLHEQIPFPKRPRSLPTVLSPEEVERLIASAKNLMHRAMLMTQYATGLRRSELCQLKVADIDSQRMVIRVRQGKGARDRDVLLGPKLLETLREYWRWMKPRTYLFPGTVNGWRADSHRLHLRQQGSACPANAPATPPGAAPGEDRGFAMFAPGPGGGGTGPVTISVQGHAESPETANVTDAKTESLGDSTIEGISVTGTKTTKTIPAGTIVGFLDIFPFLEMKCSDVHKSLRPQLVWQESTIAQLDAALRLLGPIRASHWSHHGVLLL
jgi:hypothetical protein